MKRNDCEHQDAICQMPRGHGDDVKCRFVCEDCNEEFESEDRCISQIVIATDISQPVSASEFTASGAASKEAAQVVGEIIMEFALAEHTLREVLKQLDGHQERSTISEDLWRLEKWLPTIFEQASGEEWKAAFEKCVSKLRSVFDVVNPKRNTLAHGQLVVHVSETISVDASEEDTPTEPSKSWCTMKHPQHGEVSLSESQISKVLTEAIELREQVGVLERLAGFQRVLSSGDTPYVTVKRRL